MFELQCADVVKDIWHNVCKEVMIKRLPNVSAKVCTYLCMCCVCSFNISSATYIFKPSACLCRMACVLFFEIMHGYVCPPLRALITSGKI